MSTTEVVVAALIVVGVLGTIVPVLPGSLLVLGGVLWWAIDLGTTTGWVVFAVVAALLVVGAVVKYVVPGRRLQRDGVPNSTLWFAGLCAVGGFFVIPVAGVFVGFVGGIYLAERSRVGEAEAWPSTKRALRAVGLSILIELVAVVLAALTWTVGVVVT